MASLIVHKTYVGADTFGNPIEPGTYEADHAHLYGLASYLVEIGYAELVESAEPEDVQAPAKSKRKGG
jgi:hypothetical protein